MDWTVEVEDLVIIPLWSQFQRCLRSRTVHQWSTRTGHHSPGPRSTGGPGLHSWGGSGQEGDGHC